MPYSTLADAQSGGVREQDALDTAAALVQRWARAPSPEPADYAAKAARAERLVYAYIKDTGGYKSHVNRGLDALRRGESYRGDIRRVKAIVKDAMGDYYQDESFTINVASNFPSTTA